MHYSFVYIVPLWSTFIFGTNSVTYMKNRTITWNNMQLEPLDMVPVLSGDLPVVWHTLKVRVSLAGCLDCWFPRFQCASLAPLPLFFFTQLLVAICCHLLLFVFDFFTCFYVWLLLLDAICCHLLLLVCCYLLLLVATCCYLLLLVATCLLLLVATGLLLLVATCCQSLLVCCALFAIVVIVAICYLLFLLLLVAVATFCYWCLWN